MEHFSAILILVFCIKCCTCVKDNTVTAEYLENKLRSVIEKWRLGDEIAPGLRFPSLHIYTIDPVNGKYRSSSVELYYYADGIVVQGLNRFTIENLKVSEYNDILEASAAMTMPHVQVLVGRYMVSGRAFFLPFVSSGNVTLTFKNVRLFAVIQLVKNENKKGLHVSGCAFDFEFEEVRSDLGDFWSINKIVSNESVNLINKNRLNIIDAVRYKVVAYANEYLESISKIKAHRLSTDDKKQ